MAAVVTPISAELRDLALRLDPGFAKALARRATARAALGTPAAAAADLRAALAVAPRPDRGPLRARLRDLEGECFLFSTSATPSD